MEETLHRAFMDHCFRRDRNRVPSFADEQVTRKRKHIPGKVDEQNAGEPDLVIDKSNNRARYQPSALPAGVLFIDFASYVLSFACYLFVRKGRHTVAVAAETVVHESAVERFFHELREGISFIRLRPRLMLTGLCWALFIGGMLTQGVITAPFSDRLLKAGAVGYGWLEPRWAICAQLSALFTPTLVSGTGICP